MKKINKEGLKKLIQNTNYSYNSYVYKLEKMGYKVSILDEITIQNEIYIKNGFEVGEDLCIRNKIY